VTALSEGGTPHPSLRSPLPGHTSRAYLRRQENRESNARTYPRRIPLAIRRAYGSWLEDVDGNVLIDFLAGAGALPLGHSHPEVVEAAVRQLRLHAHGLDLPTPAKDEFTEANLALLPQSMRTDMKVHFCGPTGANAVEAALKLCKTVTGRSEIISFTGGFHGSTHGAMAVTSLVEQKEPVPGGMPGVHFFPYSYCYRCPLALDPHDCDTNCAAYLEGALTDTHGGVGRPAAVILELVQGEGGVIPATEEFALRVQALARELDVPLVVDEIQTGYGRTGTWFAFEQYGLTPDVILASKAAGGIGLPVSLMFFSRRLDRWAPGAHIGTFRGNQAAFAAGVAAISVMRRERVLDNVAVQGEALMQRLRELQQRYPFIGDVRGRGLMIGVEIVDPDTGRPDPDRAALIQAGCLRRGLVVELGGRNNAVVRMLPPLNVETRVVQTALRIIEATLNSAAAAPPDRVPDPVLQPTAGTPD
jgi:diaminobutyrate-2-oxoglutarate transaminase